MDAQKSKRSWVGSTSKTPPEVKAAAAAIFPIVDRIVNTVANPLLHKDRDPELAKFLNLSWRVREQLFRIKMGVVANGTPTLKEKLSTVEQWVLAHPAIYGESAPTLANELHTATEKAIAAGLYIKPEKPGQASTKKTQNTWMGGF